jgi:hypothetical protein
MIDLCRLNEIFCHRKMESLLCLCKNKVLSGMQLREIERERESNWRQERFM